MSKDYQYRIGPDDNPVTAPSEDVYDLVDRLLSYSDDDIQSDSIESILPPLRDLSPEDKMKVSIALITLAGQIAQSTLKDFERLHAYAGFTRKKRHQELALERDMRNQGQSV